MSETIHLQRTVPVLRVAAIPEAVAFYGERLGFTKAFEAGDYVGVTRGDVMLHLDGYTTSAIGSITCRVELTGVDAIFAELEPQGVVDPAEPLHTMPWGAKQFSVLDCCGNRITFVEQA